MKAWLVRIIALIVFAVSFALPAIRPPGSGAAPQPVPGWTCALVASVLGPKALVQSFGQGISREAIAVVTSGLANYLFLVLFVLSFWRRLARIRLLFGTLYLFCFLASWIYFASAKTTPLVGHFLWVAGAFLFLVPDVVILIHQRRTAAAEASAASTPVS
jgi:hypothetical protein